MTDHTDTDLGADDGASEDEVEAPVWELVGHGVVTPDHVSAWVHELPPEHWIHNLYEPVLAAPDPRALMRAVTECCQSCQSCMQALGREVMRRLESDDSWHILP